MASHPTIVVPLIGPHDDPHLISERAIPAARALRGQLGGSVVLVSVVERPFDADELGAALNHQSSSESRRLIQLRDYLEEVAATFPDGDVQVVLRSGTTADEIEQEVHNVHQPILVMASHGRVGMERMLLGSVATTVIHDVDCPVVLVRERLPNAYSVHNLLIPLDGSAVAESAVDRALDALAAIPLRLHLLHVIEPFTSYYGFVAHGYLETATRWADDYLDQVARRYSDRGYEVTTKIRRGFVTEQIAEAAAEERVDLIVLSTRGHHAVQRALFGWVTERTLHESALPLLVVRPHDTSTGTG